MVRETIGGTRGFPIGVGNDAKGLVQELARIEGDRFEQVVGAEVFE